MKIKNKIINLGAATLGLFTSCMDEFAPIFIIDEAENTIVLRAGVNESGVGAKTRALNNDDAASHVKHTPFDENTVIALRMDGLWNDHSPSDIKKKTNATLGGASGADNKHNELTSFTPQFYWDDYGTADPSNTTGRNQGLTIYGAAINGQTSLPTSLSTLTETQSTWTSLSWTIDTNQKEHDIIKSDLLTSNNVVYNLVDDNAYKFANRNNGKLLVFTHAMSKITVELTAGNGFKRNDADDPETAYFENEPTVTLKNFYNKGTVNVESKTSTPTTTGSNPTPDIDMHREGTATWTNSHKTTFEAIVFPGKTFADNDQILTFSVDGNSFNVTAAELNKAIKKAIDENTTTGYPLGSSDLTADPKVYDTNLIQAWNYKLQIKVHKTALGISATIVNWNEVTAAEETPVINVTSKYGYTTAEGGSNVTDFTKDYDLFRSTTKETGYDEDGNTAGIQYAARYTASSSTWDKTIYWPDHQTHYFFRGVYPQVGTTASGTPSGTTLADEAVTTENGKDVIAVANAEYTADTYPSDLAIAFPRGTTDGSYDETCKAGHTTGSDPTPGICATEGTVYMNFEYVMSKVQFSLKSSANTTDPDYVDLTYADVEIIDGKKSGKIRLSDGKHEDFVSGDKGNYTLNRTTPKTGFTITTLDAIVPQTLGNDVKVRITIKDGSGNSLDVYEAQLNEIMDSSSAKITEWKPGNYYKYELTLTKTAIKVIATIKNWVEITATDKVWF